LNQQAISNPKVFVSYSWTTPEHEESIYEYRESKKQRKLFARELALSGNG
jgi:hypothetical protein